MPSLSKYYEQLNYTMRHSLDAYVRSKGMHPEKIWSGVRETIRQVMMVKAREMQPLVTSYKHPWLVSSIHAILLQLNILCTACLALRLLQSVYN